MTKKIIKLQVEAEHAGKRLDLLLAAMLPDCSRSYLQKLIKNGAVRCGGAVCTAQRSPVKTGDRIIVEIEAAESNVPVGENIDLRMVHGRDLGLVKVDQGQLEQVIINLAVNARDAMPNGGRLTIETRNLTIVAPVRRDHEEMPAGDYVMIEIKDTGIGIPPENRSRIFEPFFSTKPVGSGTGE